MPLEKIIENMDLVVGQFARCDIRNGWRLNLAEPRSVVLHFVLMGEAELIYDSVNRRLSRGMIVMVPPQLAHSLQVGPVKLGGQVDGDASSLPTGTAAHIDLGDSEPDPFVMACGRVEATYGGMGGIFDAFDDAVVVDLSEQSGAPELFDMIYREQRRGAIGSCQMVSALMQQAFIVMLRALQREGFSQMHTLAAVHDPQINRSLSAIMEEPGADHSVESLARVASMSRSSFSERFRTAFDRTPMDYVREVRLRKAAALLRRTDLGVETIAGKVGYSSRTHFSKAFSDHYSVSPRDYRTAIAMPQLAKGVA
jgi:AraC family transcriptional activator of mtrCDE